MRRKLRPGTSQAFGPPIAGWHHQPFMDLLPILRIADSTAILVGLIFTFLLIADKDDRTAVGLGLPRGTRLTPQAKRRGRLGWLLILAAMVANFLRQLSSEGTTIELILAGAVLVLAVASMAVNWLAVRQLRRDAGQTNSRSS